jgi:hypothetical protein
VAPSIALNLGGDGRVVRLTPATVRAAFFQFVAVNGLTYRDLRPFEAPGLTSPQQMPLLDRLFGRSGRPAYLTPFEIAAVERQINALLLGRGMALVEDEGRILDGQVSGRGAGLCRRRAEYVIRHGIIFELETLHRETLLREGARDVVVEDRDHSIQVVRFLGVGVDHRAARLLLHFANRLDLRQTWSVPQSAFKCRRLFAVRRVAAADGFHLHGPLVTGQRAQVTRVHVAMRRRSGLP